MDQRGLGKTFLTVTLAVTAHSSTWSRIKRVIFDVPAVEAGRARFHQGSQKKKNGPLSRPFYDALLPDFREKAKPLGWWSGDYRDCAFGLYASGPWTMPLSSRDEAQNTIMQMKMFWPSWSFNSKMIVNGDIARLTFLEMSNPKAIDAQEKWRAFLKLTLCISRSHQCAELSGPTGNHANPVLKKNGCGEKQEIKGKIFRIFALKSADRSPGPGTEVRWEVSSGWFQQSKFMTNSDLRSQSQL